MRKEEKLLTPSNGWKTPNTLRIVPVSAGNASLLQRAFL